MAAGLGFKTFTTGEVLTAADTNGYLMQGVLVFATAAARNAAITSPQEGQFAFTKDTNGLWYYDGAAWVASGATGDIEGVTAGTGISGGGTSGTVTVTNSMATAITTNGDVIYGTGSGTFTRLGIGSSATVLTVAGGVPTWAAPSGSSGPAFSAYSATNQSISSGVYTKITFGSEDFDTAGNFASNRFTPTTAGYYQINFGGYVDGSGATNYGSARLYFNGSAIRACNFTDTTNDYSPVLADVIYFNGSTDYLEVFTYLNGGGTVVGNASAPRYTYFSGVWIRS